MIKFFLNESLKEADDICPNTTVLEYLRLHEKKVGTKEGCASGDCGACTVAVGELNDGVLSYKNINSCISLIGSLHGKQLLSVEDLSDSASGLHPTQQAMVDCHGSQCGFCTPGFVMSLFSLYQDKSEFNKHECEQYLAGNLCRCTGYQPILNAAEAFNATARDDKFIRARDRMTENLRLLKEANESAALFHAGNVYFLPRSINELSALLSEHKGARLCAGTTDLALEITQQNKQINTLIYTACVDELTQVHVGEDLVEIGAAVSYEQALPVVQIHFPAFVDMILRLGSKQVRNVATFGGNIGNASPIGDTPPCFIALGAELVLVHAKQKRSIQVEDYFIDYKKTDLKEGEFIKSVNIPKLKQMDLFKTYKISKRIDDDISAVAAAFKFSFTIEAGQKIISDARIAFGGMAGTPKRATCAEQQLIGLPWSEATINDAMIALEKDFTPLDDVRASAAYRMQIAKNLLYKCYLESSDSDLSLTIESVDVSNFFAVKS